MAGAGAAHGARAGSAFTAHRMFDLIANLHIAAHSTASLTRRTLQAVEGCASLDEMHRCRAKYLRAVARYCLLGCAARWLGGS